MSATAGKHSKGSKASAVSTPPRGNIYDRIAEARAKRDAVTSAAKAPSKAQISSLPEPVEDTPPPVPFEPDIDVAPLKEKKAPANLATFPALIEADPPAPEPAPEKDDDLQLAKPILWGASLLLAALVIGVFLTRAGPGDGTQSEPATAQPSEPLPDAIATSAPKPRPRTETSATASPAQFPDVPNLVIPKEPSAPPPAPQTTQGPRLALSAPALADPPKIEPAPTLRDDGSVSTLARFDPDAYRIVVQAPRSIPEAALKSIVQSLDVAGLVAEPRSVNLSISRSNVRFYHAEDAALATFIADNIRAEARDFTSFRPRPAPGLIEIWLEGRRGRVATSTGSDTSFAASLRRLQDGLRRALGQR